MYTTEKSEIAKLRAYRRELNGLYAQALDQRDWRRAHALADSRRRVVRAILVYEEWHPRPGANWTACNPERAV